MIRVLVAEAAADARARIVELLERAPGITVIAQARDGAEAVELAVRRAPDLVLMSARMPAVDGCEATKEIMVRTPRPVVIMSSGADEREVELSLGALRAGALTVVERPDERAPSAVLGERLLSTVRAMAEVKVVRRWAPRPLRPARAEHRTAPGAIRLVAVAASTGGPVALQQLFAALPRGFQPPLLVVQHIAKGFVDGLAAWLSASCDLHVRVARDGEPLRPRTAYLAPDDRHLGARPDATVTLSDAPAVGGFRPSATYLFESVARSHGPAAAAVVLTGMGRDGVDGLRAVRAAGGRVLAQDEASCVVFGMPQEAARTGLVEAALPVAAIAARLVELAG